MTNNQMTKRQGGWRITIHLEDSVAATQLFLNI